MNGLGLALLIMVLMVPAGRGAWWLACRGIEDGDRLGDPQTSVSLGADQSIVVEVENSTSESIVVGWHVRPRRIANCLQVLTPTLVVRTLHRSERRRADDGASGILGAVDAHSACSWHLLGPTLGSRLRLILGLPGGRIRVHDHAVPGLPSHSGVDSRLRTPNSPGNMCGGDVDSAS
jgi:hypothetical protein